MIEIDLRTIKGEIVASHDEKPKAAHPPKLAEILNTIKHPLNLEVKESGFELELVQAIKGFPSEVLISSKKLEVLEKIRTLDGRVRLGLVLSKGNFYLLPKIKTIDQKLDLYSIHPEMFLTKKPLVRYLKTLKKLIFVWTVNSPKQFHRFQALGVDGVFTDYPNLFKHE